MNPGELAAVVSATGAALGGLVTAASVLTGIRWGREKVKADAELAREQLGKARAERRHAETTAQLEAIAGELDARLDALEASLETVHHEVTPNHGGSIKDAVKRIEEALDAHGHNLDTMQARVSRMSEELHDERTAREAAQRTLDKHSHDAHARLHERLDKLEERIEK